MTLHHSPMKSHQRYLDFLHPFRDTSREISYEKNFLGIKSLQGNAWTSLFYYILAGVLPTMYLV